MVSACEIVRVSVLFFDARFRSADIVVPGKALEGSQQREAREASLAAARIGVAYQRGCCSCCSCWKT